MPGCYFKLNEVIFHHDLRQLGDVFHSSISIVIASPTSVDELVLVLSIRYFVDQSKDNTMSFV